MQIYAISELRRHIVCGRIIFEERQRFRCGSGYDFFRVFVYFRENFVPEWAVDDFLVTGFEIYAENILCIILYIFF